MAAKDSTNLSESNNEPWVNLAAVDSIVNRKNKKTLIPKVSLAVDFLYTSISFELLDWDLFLDAVLIA